MNRLLIRNLREIFPFSLFLSAVLLNFPLIQSLASEAPPDLVYQGRIFKPDSSALEASNVVFDVSVYSPDGSCLLYEESHSVNMAGSGGTFSLAVGMGAPVGPAYSVKEVFSNLGSFTGGGSCSYTPVSGHSRIIRVTFDDGGGAIALQDQLIKSVPYALYASKLEGKGKSDFLQINTTTSALSQANANSLFQNATYSELIALAEGTSNVFAKSADLPIASGVLNLSGAGQGVRVLDTPAGADHAVNRNYTDGKIGGKSIDAANFAGLSNGESLKWDTSANTGLGGWVRSSGSLPAAAGTAGAPGYAFSGNTNTGVFGAAANEIGLSTNGTEKVRVDASGKVGIGVSAPAATLEVAGDIKVGNSSATCSATTKGSIRYNNATSVLEFCNGTGWNLVQAAACSDPTPNVFTFTNQANQTTSTLITSDIAQVTGINCSVPVTISGLGSPQFQICSDSSCTTVVQGWTTGPSSITNNQYLQTRLTSNVAGGATNAATVIVGDGASIWNVATASGDCSGSPAIGTVCADGSIYAGMSADAGGVKMYTTRCDFGRTWNGTTCTGSRLVQNWNNGTANWTTTGYTNGNTGKSNSSGISALADAGSIHYASRVCEDLNEAGHTDWYLPALNELNVLYTSRSVILNFSTGGSSYWSSTEFANSYAYSQRFSDGAQNSFSLKHDPLIVRCVRR